MARATRSVGRNVLRKEGVEKVTGGARYIDDLAFANLLHARTIRSTIPAGEIASIRFDFNTAGFVIADHRDIPGRNVVALIDDDQPCLAERTIRHAAEPILLLAHEDRDALLRFLMSEPLDSSHPGLADGFRVARRLDREGRLGPAGRRELFAVQFVWRERHGSMVRRRWPRIGFSAEPDGLLIAVYAVRAWLFRLPIPRSAAQPPTPDPPEPEDRRVSPAPRSGTEYLNAV